MPLTFFTRIKTMAIRQFNACHHHPSLHGSLMELSFGSCHGGGVHFSMGDANARFINDTIDPDLYLGLGSRDGGELVGGL